MTEWKLVAAIAAFVLLLGLLGANCVAVRGICHDLLALADAGNYAGAAKLLAEKTAFLSMTVRRDLLLSLENAAEAAEADAKTGESGKNAAAFRTAVEAILRAETPSVQSIF